ncbi:MAG: GntR family transcriptional regulator [Candidatus Symbiothrix sp.]|jgi:DNA-binding LacI/PurR family transcriptional regulator|nr:GntR family transcriptional regulator [Candidatus Symbiothrix sp.]
MKKNQSKYKLIVNHVIDGIHSGALKKGDWTPSIHAFMQMYRLSRDTVFAGLSELKFRGIIDSTPGVGYYILTTQNLSDHNIFLLFNEFNEFKEELYNSFIESVEKSAAVDIYFHNYNRKVFETLIAEANGKYTTYIIMSGKFKGIDPLLKTLNGKVFLLDHFHPELKGKYSSVSQNFEKDTYEALVYGLPSIKKYRHIYMVQKEEKEPQERYNGLCSFCRDYHFSCEYIHTTQDREIKPGEIYMVVKDRDLVDLLKQAGRQALTPGKEFGIISYNDTPLKEILAGGITTLSTDFRLMGKTMAALINKKGIETVENPWRFHLRRSL